MVNPLSVMIETLASYIISFYRFHIVTQSFADSFILDNHMHITALGFWRMSSHITIRS